MTVHWALYQGLLHVSRECAGRPPRFVVDPLPTGETRPEVFKQWFRNFIDVRDEDAAERCLRTAIELDIPPRDIADMIFAASTDHIYLDAGHTLDFANKAFELLDHIGWEYASPDADQPGPRHGARPPQPGTQCVAAPYRPGVAGVAGPRGVAVTLRIGAQRLRLG